MKYEPYKAMNIKEVQNELSELIGSDEVIAVVLKSSGKLIGNLYLGKRDFNTLELGCVFNKKYWHQGFAKESAQAIIQKAFNDGTHRIFAECDPCNTSSWQLWENLGFIKEAHF